MFQEGEEEAVVGVTEPQGEGKLLKLKTTTNFKMVLMTAGGDGSVFKFDPAIDSAILKELDEAEKQAKATAKV